jgi:SAM-dependent methyltransferase
MDFASHEEIRSRDICRYYLQWWENPHDPRSVVFSKLNRLVHARLPVGKGKNALDLGSGKGTIVALLREKRFEVTSVEMSEDFARQLRKRFPGVTIRTADAREIDFNTTYDLVTAIEFVQNLDPSMLRGLLQRVASVSGRIHLNISNRNSLHGWWSRRRGFQLPFVHTYTPEQIADWFQEAGFKIVFSRGVGLRTPITLWNGFRGKLIPIWLTKMVNPWADRLFPNWCHLYYLEAEKIKQTIP